MVRKDGKVKIIKSKLEKPEKERQSKERESKMLIQRNHGEKTMQTIRTMLIELAGEHDDAKNLG